MVLHNSKWDKKAAKNYYKKHGIAVPKSKRQIEYEEKLKEQQNWKHKKNYGDDSSKEESEDEIKSSEDESAEETAAGSSAYQPESTKLVNYVNAALGEEDTVKFQGKRSKGKKNLRPNNWRYAEEDDDDIVLDESKMTKEQKLRMLEDPEYHAKILRLREEREHDEKQMLIARQVLSEKLEKLDLLEKQREEEEKEQKRLKREQEEERRKKFASKDYIPTLEEIEDQEDNNNNSDKDTDDDDDDYYSGHTNRIHKNKNFDVPYKKNPKLVKISKENAQEYYEIQEKIDHANIASTILDKLKKNPDGSTKSLRASSSPSATKNSLHLDENKPKKVLKLESDGSLVKDRSKDSAINVKKLNINEGTTPKRGLTGLDEEEDQDIDDFLATIEDSKNNDNSDDDNDDDDDNSDEFDPSGYKFYDDSDEEEDLNDLIHSNNNSSNEYDNSITNKANTETTSSTTTGTKSNVTILDRDSFLDELLK